MHILGIETSCDETAAAVVACTGSPGDGSWKCRVRSNAVYSQIAHHRPYGGVVPEIASRQHVEVLPSILQEALAEADVKWDELDAIAVTRGPGLASSLLIGVSAAKALSLRLNKPLMGVNHLEGHLLSIFLGDQAPRPEDVCPLVVLLVSGGHTCLLRVDSLDHFCLLGQTLDDAAGEALDKGASLLRLGYPGGPIIEKTAKDGDTDFVRFPRGLTRGSDRTTTGGLRRDLCFSFSGVKTALRYYIDEHPSLFEDGTLADVAASYQEAVLDSLIEKTRRALKQEGVRHVACVGGVVRNLELRNKLLDLAAESGSSLWLADPQYCTDNAAMVAARAALYGPGERSKNVSFDVDPNLSIGLL